MSPLLRHLHGAHQLEKVNTCICPPAGRTAPYLSLITPVPVCRTHSGLVGRCGHKPVHGLQYKHQNINRSTPGLPPPHGHKGQCVEDTICPLDTKSVLSSRNALIPIQGGVFIHGNMHRHISSHRLRLPYSVVPLKEI